MQLTEICEVVTSILGVTIAFISIILIVVGWVIPYKQNRILETKRIEAEQEFQRIKWEKEMIDRQISLFYGPISALLNQHNIIRKKVFEQLHRNYVFDCDRPNFEDLPEREQKIWAHYNDNYKLPIMNKIVKVIKENYHLIYNSIMPVDMKAFMNYALEWELLDNQKRNGVPNKFDYKCKENFPHEFVDYIDRVLKILQINQAELIKKLEMVKDM